MVEPNEFRYKICSFCRSDLPEHYYGNNRNSYDGLTHYCKDCANPNGFIYLQQYDVYVNRIYAQYLLNAPIILLGEDNRPVTELRELKQIIKIMQEWS